MHMENNKNKKTPKVDIKLEPQITYPLSHYVDDRVELIRQIFSCLKSKSIKAIAPDFLQTKNVDTIQEYCLDELLGISKKRLLSIINATKCPTDTESSESDVEKIDEHISLEEISSDSDDNQFSKNVKNVKTKKSTGVGGKQNGTAKPAPKKKVSVLELLELQARARAIRSQLALEPVTKIELDSDNDSLSDSSTISTHASQPAKTKPVAGNSSTTNTNVKVNNSSSEKTKPIGLKPVRLKRNFRQRQMEDYDDDDRKSDSDIEPQKESITTENGSTDIVAIDSIEPNTKNTTENTNKPSEIEEKKEVERSPSPDIITIVRSPETLLISSESENEDAVFLMNMKATSYMRNVPKPNLPETEDEKFLKKIKNTYSKDTNQSLEQEKISNEKTGDAEQNVNYVESTITNENIQDNSSEILNESDNLVENQSEQIQVTEPEEGEILDFDDENDSDSEKDNNINGEILKDNAAEITVTQTNIENTSENEHANNVDDNLDENSEHCDKKNISNITDECSELDDSKESKHLCLPNMIDNNSMPIEIDDDDDIIDLGKDEELDFEREDSELEQTDIAEIPRKKQRKKTKRERDHAEHIDNHDERVECIESEVAAESWGARWLKGKKVSKIMATSRLANKVRSKIKNKKLLQETSVTVVQTPVEEKQEVPLQTTVEEGSVEHYQTILAVKTEN